MMGKIQTLCRFFFNLDKSKSDLDWNLSSTQISENAFHQSDLPCLRLLLFDAEINKDGKKVFDLKNVIN